MDLGVSLEPLDGVDGGTLLSIAKKAERLGFGYVLMSGHVLKNPIGSAMDAMLLLAAVASATSQVRLATSIVVISNYHPVMLANQAATLDVLSGGRFVLGVGAGWNRDEFEALGIPVNERGQRADEYLKIMRLLWSGEPASFDGQFVTLRHAQLGVAPRTRGGPLLWCGGNTDAAIRRALLLGDGWLGRDLDHRGVLEVRARMARLGEVMGRDPTSLRLNTVSFVTPPGFSPDQQSPSLLAGGSLGGANPTSGSILDELGRLQEAGISMCSLWMPLAAAKLTEALDWLAEEIIAALPSTSNTRTI